MILVIPFAYLLIVGSNVYIILSLLVIMFLSDLLDGYYARKFNQISEIGKIIDPLADKFAIISIVILLFLQGRIETWFFAIVVLRDLFILIFGLYLKSKNKIVLMSNYPGKIAVLSIGVIIFLIILDSGNSELLKKIISYLYYISVLLIVYSLYLYLIRFIKLNGEVNGKSK